MLLVWIGPRLALLAEAEHDLRTEDHVMEMPQPGERAVGRDGMRAMQQAFPHPLEPPQWRA